VKRDKITACSLEISCRTLLNPTLFVGQEVCKIRSVAPVAGQTLYILDRSASDILKENKNVIWGNLLKKVDSNSRNSDHISADHVLGKDIKRILRTADVDPRKYPAALMNIAALTSSFTTLICASYEMATLVLKDHAIRYLKTRTGRKGPNRRSKSGNLFYLRRQ